MRKRFPSFRITDSVPRLSGHVRSNRLNPFTILMVGPSGNAL